jgi:DDE superfamily endonuclease
MRLEPHRLVFLDETGTTTKMTRLRGRCLKGKRLRSKAPFGHWKTQTFVAGLRCGALTAPFVIDAPMDRRIFETYVETQLVPTLEKGDIVVMDMCGRPRRCKKNLFEEGGAWSGADMCPASCCGLSHAAGPYGSSQSGSNSI